MKSLVNFIQEGLKLGSSKINGYNEHPQTKEELQNILKERLEKDHNADLNDIDVSKVINMEYLFNGLENLVENIEIDQWDVSNVESMMGMFSYCYNFNADLSKWDVRNVKDMYHMFKKCKKFNSDISKWNVSEVQNMDSMFYDCESFNQDLSEWDVSYCKNFGFMFYGCKKFNCDLNKWKVKKIRNPKRMQSMFKDTPLENHLPKWFKS